MSEIENKQPTIRKSSLAPTILVSGGAGFIGSHLVEALLLNGAKVIVLDNFATGKKSYLSGVSDNPKFSLIECDINEGIPNNIETVDYIYQLAGLESYIYGDEKITLDSLLTNAVGTKNLLDLAKKSYAKFILVSSIDVYEGLISSLDINHYFGQTETAEKKYSHSEAKRFAEALVWEYYKKHKINSRIVRLPEVYGPRMDFNSGGELGRLIKCLIDQTDLTIYGDGLEKNYYLFITDAIAGLIKAQFSDTSEGKIFTLINGEPITTLELTYLIKRLSNRETQVSFKNPSGEKPKDINIINTDSVAEIKWGAKVDLKTGVMKTLKWYGYDFNLSHFKPGKLISDKDARSSIAEGGITTIRHEDASKQAATTPRKGFTFPKLAFLHPSKQKISENQQAKPSTSPSKARFKMKARLLVPFAILFSVVIAFVVFAVIPAVQTYVYAKSGYQNLLGAEAAIEKLDLDSALSKSRKAQNDFGAAQGKFSRIGWLFLLANQENRLHSYAKLLDIGRYSSTAINNASSGIRPLIELWDSVKPQASVTLDKNTITKANLNFQGAKEQLSRAQGELNDIDLSVIPQNQKADLQKIAARMPEAINMLSTAQSAVSALPDVLGVSGTKKYLILFQNSNELRPTGGFIGSYAVVDLEAGKIKEINIDDIYNVDGLLDLNGDKTPSNELFKKYLKQDYLRIRDANWDPSFPKSAATIKSLFEEANGTKFDGVVAIDTYLLRDILKATGPVFLTAYNESINADNVYEKTQYHAEAEYKEGSQQKKAFLTILGKKVLETVFSQPGNNLSGLTTTLIKDMEQKHILVYLPNTQAAALLAERGWDGAVKDTKTDYLYVVDSNLGANKANYFVRETASYEIKNMYRDGSIEVLLTVNYSHTGKDSVWPGGVYTDYQRILVPKDSFLQKATVKLNDAPESDVTKLIKVDEADNKRTFENTLTINPGDKLTTTFDYTLPPSISIKKDSSIYSLYWQKQPGTDTTPIQVIFNVPFGKDVKTQNPEFTKKGKVLEYKGSLSTDNTFLIETR